MRLDKQLNLATSLIGLNTHVFAKMFYEAIKNFSRHGEEATFANLKYQAHDFLMKNVANMTIAEDYNNPECSFFFDVLEYDLSGPTSAPKSMTFKMGVKRLRHLPSMDITTIRMSASDEEGVCMHVLDSSMLDELPEMKTKIEFKVDTSKLEVE